VTDRILYPSFGVVVVVLLLTVAVAAAGLAWFALRKAALLDAETARIDAADEMGLNRFRTEYGPALRGEKSSLPMADAHDVEFHAGQEDDPAELPMGAAEALLTDSGKHRVVLVDDGDDAAVADVADLDASALTPEPDSDPGLDLSPAVAQLVRNRKAYPPHPDIAWTLHSDATGSFTGGDKRALRDAMGPVSS
jgi:hypothetical protein